MSAVEKEQPEAAKTRFAKDQLKAFVERIERLEEEKKTISDDIRDVYAEFEGQRLRRQGAARRDPAAQAGAQERQEHELILETYMNALGMLAASLQKDYSLTLGSASAAFDRSYASDAPVGAPRMRS